MRPSLVFFFFDKIIHSEKTTFDYFQQFCYHQTTLCHTFLTCVTFLRSLTIATTHQIFYSYWNCAFCIQIQINTKVTEFMICFRKYVCQVNNLYWCSGVWEKRKKNGCCIYCRWLNWKKYVIVYWIISELVCVCAIDKDRCNFVFNNQYFTV